VEEARHVVVRPGRTATIVVRPGRTATIVVRPGRSDHSGQILIRKRLRRIQSLAEILGNGEGFHFI
jgi:hypothetical protein